MFRHTVLKNLQAIDNSGKGTLYYSYVLFNLGAGVFGLLLQVTVVIKFILTCWLSKVI